MSISALTIVSRRLREIGGDDPVAATFQVLNCQRFATRAQLKSLSGAGFRFRNELVISHCSTLLCGGRFLLRSFLFFRTGRSGRRRRALTLPGPTFAESTSPDFSASRSLIAFAHWLTVPPLIVWRPLQAEVFKPSRLKAVLQTFFLARFISSSTPIRPKSWL